MVSDTILKNVNNQCQRIWFVQKSLSDTGSDVIDCPSIIARTQEVMSQMRW